MEERLQNVYETCDVGLSRSQGVRWEVGLSEMFDGLSIKTRG